MTIASWGPSVGTDPMVRAPSVDDEGVISNWANTPYDLRRRGSALPATSTRSSSTTRPAAALRELALLDPDW